LDGKDDLRMTARSPNEGDGRATVSEADPGPDPGEAVSVDALFDQIKGLHRASNGSRDPDLDRRARHLRHLAGRLILERAPANPEYAVPTFDSVPPEAGVVEVTAADLTPGLLRAAILRHGCLLVRGLVDRDDALGLAEGIERAFEARRALGAGGSAGDGYYEEFEPEPPYRVAERPWVEMGGGVLAVDSPTPMFDMFEALNQVGFPEVVHGYLGERAAISAQKTTLRKAEPDVRGAWHQDGKFLGEVRALNLWLSLSRCGEEAPGLDIVPRRIDHVLEAGTDSEFPIEVSPAAAEVAAGDVGILRPIFEPGDALLFDELFLHQTGSDPQMPKPRYAIESWFFGPSAFPSDYAPLAA
jgi:hypothetical protein